MKTVKEGFMPFHGLRTYYRIVGEASQKPPLVLLHGGPGSSHNYFEVLDDLAERDQRQLIMYDQLGCGQSSQPDDQADLFYNKKNWAEELSSLRKYLGLKKIHLLGQSWGGMLAIIYLCDYQPDGVRSVILSSTLSSAKLWASELHRLQHYLPQAEQAAIKDAESRHDFTGQAYEKANDHFMAEHVIAPSPDLPEPVRRKKIGGQIAYLTGWGPNEYSPEGNLHNYEYTNQLKKITQPALITSGTDDLCTPLVAKTMFDALPNARWELFQGCGHMPFVQETDRYLDLLQAWLNEHD
jgi:proline iminopeptidase